MDQNGNIIVPVDRLGCNVVPTDENNVPKGENTGKPTVPLDKDGNAIMNVGGDGRPMVNVGEDGKPVLGIDKDGDVV